MVKKRHYFLYALVFRLYLILTEGLESRYDNYIIKNGVRDIGKKSRVSLY